MDLNDKKAWDDSDLISTWDEALEEYKKYHSIHLSGKKLEDALTKEEMAQVIAQRKALRKGGHDRPLRRYEEEDQVQASEDEEKDMSMSPERDISLEIAIEEPAPQAQTSTTSHAALQNALPQMPLMVGVQDENLKNLLMAWYYAGYHTGLYEGRKQVLDEVKDSSSKI